MADHADIEFFWDPICPFAWQTSRWIRRVAGLRGLTIGWRFINLSILNEERYDDADSLEGKREPHERGRRMLRVAASVRAAEGDAAMGPLYEAFGETIWSQEVEPGAHFLAHVAAAEHLEAVLTRAGFDLGHAEAADDPSVETSARRSSPSDPRTGRQSSGRSSRPCPTPMRSASSCTTPPSRSAGSPPSPS